MPPRPWLVSALAALVGVLPSACDASGTDVPVACTLAAPAPPDWRLHTDGTLLRDGLDRVVFLRGVDAGGRSKMPPYMPFDYGSDADFASALSVYMGRAASWGIDAIRVPFTWAALEPTQGQNDANWISRYQQLLAAAWAHGIWTVVDFHQDVYSQCLCGDGFPCWTLSSPGPAVDDCPTWQLEYLNDPAVEGAFDAFWPPQSPVLGEYQGAWDFMARMFAGEPGVLGFEPINEPSSGSANPQTFEATTLTSFFSTMIARLRDDAPTSLVFVDATNLDGVFVSTNLQRPVGDFVFAPHFYPLGVETTTVEPGLAKWAALGAAWNVPVWVGEFGTSHDSTTAAALMTAHFAALDTLGMGGAEWEYSVSTESWNSETDSVVGSDGAEYPVASALIRPFARAVAGSGIAQSWDPASRTFRLSFRSSTGTSEVQLPVRAFPGGYDVSLSNGCYDATTVPGRMLVQAQGGEPVTLVVTGKGP